DSLLLEPEITLRRRYVRLVPPFEPEVRSRSGGTTCANFGFGALGDDGLRTLQQADRLLEGLDIGGSSLRRLVAESTMGTIEPMSRRRGIAEALERRGFERAYALFPCFGERIGLG